MAEFNYQKDQHGIVTITMDMQGPVNSMNLAYMDLLQNTVDQLEAETDLTGVVITSAKDTFFAGGDLKWLLAVEKTEIETLYKQVEGMKANFRRLEKLPVPVVAAINGSALGGGFEICLACNYRLAWQDKSLKVGLPEVGLGLLPGAGGIVRSIHMHGLEKAFPVLSQGRPMSPQQALDFGWLDALTDDKESLVEQAKAWIQANADQHQQPWDSKGHKVPGGNANHPGLAAKVAFASAQLQQTTRGLLPAPERILDCCVEATRVDFDTALRIESRQFVELVVHPVAKNIINTMFFNMNKVKGGINRPQDIAPNKVQRLGVLGAGMMGQGIAYSAAMAGIRVHLKDLTQEAADKGKAYTQKLLQKRVDKGRMSSKQMAQVLANIEPTCVASDLQGCDLIIEAVFERKDLKDKVLAEHEALLAENGVWGSNTSTLPITQLAASAKQQSNFIGLHFFSPVDKMPLLEIICGDQTSDETLAKAFDFARQINKTPIVVNDATGFYTSRVIFTKLDEGMQLVAEGLDPVLVDNLGKAVGFPVGMLTLMDELKLWLPLEIHDTQEQMGLRDPNQEPNPEARAMLRCLVEEHGRRGRIEGGGFFDYQDDQKSIWPGLQAWRKPEVEISHDDIKDRMLFRPVIESLKCLEEGVIRQVADANIGSVLGIGAPMWTGGYLQFINTYGKDKFIRRCEELASLYGDRFTPPKVLSERDTFY